MRIKVPFGLHAYEDRSLPVNAQKLVNFFVEAQPQDSKNNPILNNTPGTTLFATVGSGPIYGMYVLDNILYVVSGESLYSVTTTGITTFLGQIVGNARCSMSDNRFELCIVNGHKGYIYTPSTTALTAISDPAFYPTTNRVAYLQGRFIFPIPNSNQFFCSNYQDGLTYDALNYENVLTKPGDVVSEIADHGELWIFGIKGAEIWVYNRDESSFPFSRIDGSYVEKGCAAAHSIARLENSFYWLGDDLVIYRAQGYIPNRISTHAIERKIKSYGDVSDAFGLTFVEEGHYFYELTFPDHESWRYDATTGLWHQPQSGTSGRYHANAHEFFNNRNLIGDYRNGNIYELSMNQYTDAGDRIYRIASTPHIHSGRQRTVMDELNIDIESGTGLTTGQGNKPQVMLRYSDDGGRTWSNERWANMGPIGEYSRRVKFHQLGMFYQRMFQLTISDPIKPVIIDAFADVEAEEGR